MFSVALKAGNPPTACPRTTCSSRHATLECVAALEMMAALTPASAIHFSGSHSGAVRTSGEVPGRSEEAQPARRRTRAAHGHLPALPRYCSCSFLRTTSVLVGRVCAFSDACKGFTLEPNLLILQIEIQIYNCPLENSVQEGSMVFFKETVIS